MPEYPIPPMGLLSNPIPPMGVLIPPMAPMGLLEPGPIPPLILALRSPPLLGPAALDMARCSAPPPEAFLLWSNLQVSFFLQRAPNLQGLPFPAAFAVGLSPPLAGLAFSPLAGLAFSPLAGLAFFSAFGLGTGGWPNAHLAFVHSAPLLQGFPFPSSLSLAALILSPTVSVS